MGWLGYWSQIVHTAGTTLPEGNSQCALPYSR
jgi:hypothetical protein